MIMCIESISKLISYRNSPPMSEGEMEGVMIGARRSFEILEYCGRKTKRQFYRVDPGCFRVNKCRRVWYRNATLFLLPGVGLLMKWEKNLVLFLVFKQDLEDQVSYMTKAFTGISRILGIIFTTLLQTL